MGGEGGGNPIRDMAERTTILRVPAGSTLHGLHLPGKDDRDEVGICIEDLDAAMGFSHGEARFEQYIYRSAEAREGRRDAPSQHGDLDLVIYSLRKFLRLALDGNPQILQCFFVPPELCLRRDAQFGRQLQDMAPLIVSRRAGHRYIGYLRSQRECLLGSRGKDVTRPALEAAHGFDTKFAMHVLRLGYQGVELMTTGRVTLPMRAADRNFVYATRLGEVPLPDVLARASELESQITDRLNDSPLRAEPARDEVEAWMLKVYFECWRFIADHDDSRGTMRATARTSTDDSMKNACRNCGAYHDGPCQRTCQCEIYQTCEICRGEVL